jgi:hypothetical protein
MAGTSASGIDPGIAALAKYDTHFKKANSRDLFLTSSGRMASTG